jgi:hypothetical protein
VGVDSVGVGVVVGEVVEVPQENANREATMHRISPRYAIFLERSFFTN